MSIDTDPQSPRDSSGAALAAYREKWREAPRGSDTDGRVFSTDLLALPDAQLLAAWNAMAARRYAGELGWLGPLYFDTLRRRKAIELGSGLGFDGLRFAAAGTHWTFADIVPDNLAVIRRIAGMKGLADRVAFHLIGDDLSFDALPRDYDAVWVFGSIHHVPFEMARREALDVLGHLVPGGRWMELVYPRERWLREGAPAFSDWGKLTDGERTPWAEWHDIEKVRRRLFPAPFATLLDFEFCGHNYRWLDLRYSGGKPFSLDDFDLATLAQQVDLRTRPPARAAGARRQFPFGDPWSLACPPGLFAPAARLDLAPALQALGDLSRATEGAADVGVAVDLEVAVTQGEIGIGLVDAAGAWLPGAEAAVAAGPNTRLVTLRAVGTGSPATLVFRNLHAGIAGKFAVKSAILRPAT